MAKPASEATGKRVNDANEVGKVMEDLIEQIKNRIINLEKENFKLREEISELKYKEAYASRAYMAARRMLDERGIHMDYFLSRANYESEVKDKNNGWIPQ